MQSIKTSAYAPWTFVTLLGPRQPVDDNTSCGIFVTFALSRWLQGNSAGPADLPDKWEFVNERLELLEKWPRMVSSDDATDEQPLEIISVKGKRDPSIASDDGQRCVRPRLDEEDSAEGNAQVDVQSATDASDEQPLEGSASMKEARQTAEDRFSSNDRPSTMSGERALEMAAQNIAEQVRNCADSFVSSCFCCAFRGSRGSRVSSSFCFVKSRYFCNTCMRKGSMVFVPGGDCDVEAIRPSINGVNC